MTAKYFLDKYDLTFKTIKEENQTLKEKNEKLQNDYDILEKKNLDLNNLFEEILTNMEYRININTHTKLKRKFENVSASIITNDTKRVKFENTLTNTLTNTLGNKYDNISDDED
jgi:hypothetical protein